MTNDTLLVADKVAMVPFKVSEEQIQIDYDGTFVAGGAGSVNFTGKNVFITTGDAGEIYVFQIYPEGATMEGYYYSGFMKDCDDMFVNPLEPIYTYYTIKGIDYKNGVIVVSLYDRSDSSNGKLSAFTLNSGYIEPISNLCDLNKVGNVFLKGDRVYFQSGKNVYRWNYSWGNYYNSYPVAILPSETAQMIYSPDRKLLVFITPDGTRIFDTDTWINRTDTLWNLGFSRGVFYSDDTLVFESGYELYGYSITEDTILWRVDITEFLGDEFYMKDLAAADGLIYLLTNSSENSLVVLRMINGLPEFYGKASIPGDRIWVFGDIISIFDLSRKSLVLYR